MPQSPKSQAGKHHDFDHHTVRLDYRICSPEDIALFLKPIYTPNDQPSPIAEREIKLREAQVHQLQQHHLHKSLKAKKIEEK